MFSVSFPRQEAGNTYEPNFMRICVLFLWWIGNQPSVFLPSTHYMLGRDAAPINDPQHDKNKEIKNTDL